MSSPNQAKKRKTPGDDKKSFVEQMATKMTRLLPNTITKWFSSPSNENGSTQVAESTDSSTEDESTDSPLVNQPPAKRMRYNIPGPSNLYSVPETRSISTNTEPVEISNPVQSSANRSTMTSEPNTASKSSDETKVEKKSTSFYNLDDLQHPLRKRKSLYDTTTSSSHDTASNDKTPDNKITDADYSQQYLKCSLSIVSPFYQGRTKYGGASSSYIDHPNVKFTRTPIIHYTTSNNDVTMSNSTKRIMDLLENFSSPTIDASRLPQIMNSSANNTNQSLDSTGTSKRQLSFKNNELYVPGIASILKLKQNSRLMKTTSVARQIYASQSSSIDMYPPIPTRSSTPNASEDKNPLKMRSKVTKSNNMELEPTVVPVNLPTATLQIDKDNLPKFSFVNVPASTPSSKQTDASNNSMAKLRVISSSALKGISTDNVIINDKPVNDKWNLTESDTYKFASPIRLSADGAENSLSQQFPFGSPERNIENQNQNHNIMINQNQNMNKENNTISILEDNFQVEVLDSNEQDRDSEMDCSEADKCIICNADLEEGHSGKCLDCEKEKSAPSKPEPLIVAASTKWRCLDCWVDNENAKDKCVCCGGNKPKTKSSSTISTDKKQNDSLISNEISTSSHNTPSTSNVSTLNNIVKMQSKKWECPNCLVRNDNNISRCACCDTEKPGANKELQNKTFNFSATPNLSFKFGIDPKLNVPKTEAPKPLNPLTGLNSLENNNNNVFFNKDFELKAHSPKSSALAKPNVPAKQSETSIFSFGIPKERNDNIFGGPTSTSTSTGFSMILPKESEKSKTEQDNKPKPVSEMRIFSLKPINSIASPPSVATMPISNKPFMTTDSTTIIATTTEQVTSPSTFSFSSGLTQPVNPQSLTTSTVTSATASRALTSIEENCSAPSISFFSKTETGSNTQSMFFKNNESERSLFPKTETATTAAPQAPASSSTIFSFGNNMNAQPNVEKPKFSFTFGANKSEAPTLFNPPPAFNAPVENKFNLPTSNSISSVLPINIMNNNSMSSSNGMSTGNPLAGLVRGNGLGPGSSMGGDNLMAATVGAGNPFGGIKTDMWSPNNNGNSNIFDSNASTINVQKPAAFTFGATSSFNTGSATPAHTFGTPTQPPQPAQSAQPAQPAPTLFGVVSLNNQQQQPTLFPTPIQNQAAPNMFATTQPPAPSAGGMFGVQGFGQPNTMFEAPPMNASPAMHPTPTRSFNFGAQQPQSSMFSFSQQSSQLQQTPGVYNFGAPGGPPAVQFNMGSAPNITGRRVKKAIRRTSAR